MATPASAQPTMNTSRFVDAAITTSDTTPRPEPAVMTRRGPCRSMKRPTGTPANADTARATENAEVTATGDQPVSALIRGARTGKA